MENYIEKNKQAWNHKTQYHAASDFYDVKGFIAGNTSLNDIELNLLGEIKGKTILHLQCHFGQDSIALSRLGAQVTGIDFSEKAIEKAIALANECGTDTTFICCNLYDLPMHLDKQFDLVFTSYGTIGWLPDIDHWAQIVARFLKPNGQFVFVEFHPVVWMFDNHFSFIQYNYFKEEPIIEQISGTYADKEAPINDETISWNHAMSSVVNSLITQGLSIKLLNEYDYSPYPCFNEMVEIAPKKFIIKHLGNKIPMVYAIVGEKTTV